MTRAPSIGTKNAQGARDRSSGFACSGPKLESLQDLLNAFKAHPPAGHAINLTLERYGARCNESTALCRMERMLGDGT